IKKKLTYVFKDDPDVKGEVLCLNNKAQPVLKFGYRGHFATAFLNTFGLAWAANALCASAFGFELEVGIKNICLALESYSPVNKRMEFMKIGQVSFINDAYNANPNSMILAFDTISMIRGFDKKIAVIGDMLELGKASVKFHKQIAELAKKSKVDVLFTYGDLTVSTFKRAKELKLNAFHFTDKTNLINELRKLLSPKTLVLVKGSRKMKMEEVIGGLK
ncbi:MAG: hypothetical protein N3A61_03165, partial [Ignavibacteria bacterium]|nr:hypothetical protein [Ignavibacteria bacterium]